MVLLVLSATLILSKNSRALEASKKVLLRMEPLSKIDQKLEPKSAQKSRKEPIFGVLLPGLKIFKALPKIDPIDNKNALFEATPC